MMRRLLPFLLAAVVVPLTALAQGGISMYAPIAPKYQLGEFVYKAPTADGWRQVTTAENMFILVYAEQIDEGQINTRVQVNAETYKIPEGAADGRDTLWLTEQGQAQQVKERGENLVAFSKITPVGSNADVLSYSLVTKSGGVDIFETFYVMLAPDKESYLVAKVTTKDIDFRTQPYFSQLEASLASLEHEPQKPASPPPPPST
jgi:hypothetical protein